MFWSLVAIMGISAVLVWQNVRVSRLHAEFVRKWETHEIRWVYSLGQWRHAAECPCERGPFAIHELTPAWPPCMPLTR
jgi:hypothetical protein